jgi:hypothetical protein
MQRSFLSRMFFSAALMAFPAAAKTPRTLPELLFVGPLDTAVVTVDSIADASVLASSATLRHAPSDAALIARKFYPAFGAAISMAARKVEVIDSSAGAPRSVSNPDSARYVLTVSALAFSESWKNVPRRYMPPTPPAFDPATGTMNPGNRKGYAEGPGRVSTLTARAQWVLWDNSVRVNGSASAAARGTAVGESSYRGASAGKAQWDEAARELAKAILKQTAFAPF